MPTQIITDPEQIAKIKDLISIHQLDPEGWGPTGEPLVVFQHPHFKDVFGAVGERWGWVVDRGDVRDAADMFYLEKPEFLEVKLAADNTWRYPEEEGEDPEEACIFSCFSTWDGKTYHPTKFKVGETLYPISFTGNNAGGWIVTNADRSITEYWQLGDNGL